MNNHACILLPTKNTRPNRQPQHLMIIKKSVKLKDTSSCDPILKPRRATVISLTIWEKKSSWKPWKCMKSPQNKPESLPGTITFRQLPQNQPFWMCKLNTQCSWNCRGSYRWTLLMESYGRQVASLQLLSPTGHSSMNEDFTSSIVAWEISPERRVNMEVVFTTITWVLVIGLRHVKRQTNVLVSDGGRN